jgi:multimeric flavodoxin WrbA
MVPEWEWIEYVCIYVCIAMKKCTELLRRDIPDNDKIYTLSLVKEEYPDIYPKMARFILSVARGNTVFALFQTNSYEYAPLSSLNADTVVLQRVGEWERALRADPQGFLASHPLPSSHITSSSTTDVVVIQGSPRGEGNTSILASWAVEAVKKKKRTVQVLYPHDMDIHPCIGCYQCYNTGSCIYEDDMSMIIDAFNAAHLLVLCSPVYTMTVPAGLKALIDRCQSYHARRLLTADQSRRKGLLLAVAGRKGLSNFSCLQSTIYTFMRNLGIRPCTEVLVDGLDEIQDIRKIPDIQEKVESALLTCLAEDKQ